MGWQEFFFEAFGAKDSQPHRAAMLPAGSA
jgi:hypothetical protein